MPRSWDRPRYATQCVIESRTCWLRSNPERQTPVSPDILGLPEVCMPSLSGRWLSALASLWFVVLVLLAGPARATVTQVDGTIVPVTAGTVCAGNMQICLNTEEGSATLNSTLNASQLPEVFLPNTIGNVTFKDVAEGAGF